MFQSVDEVSSPLERKQSAFFDAKAQRQKKEEADVRAQRERRQLEYAKSNKLQELFDLLSTSLIASPPATEMEAQQRLFHVLAQRKAKRDKALQLFKFHEKIEIAIQGRTFLAAEVVSSVSGEIALTVQHKNKNSEGLLIDDRLDLQWDAFNTWEKVLHRFAEVIEDAMSHPVGGEVYASVRCDGRLTGVVPMSPLAKKIGEELWNVSAELRQSSKRVALFQPL